ncbi:hypothetical protein BOTBODRAFT_532773 [Botryobasidium botryosum FD-172 SS1]|uniref:Uncharacterized protein n=1 Tax=Botryobasidium botryosum (strain FD-172 SS1) TaxID=930990 RepID=A0A067MCN9_BOTB1|nr:hypothetical protein BOTBODRAFT_532773 [Botryobasidium botryosum FD-172 SS1]
MTVLYKPRVEGLNKGRQRLPIVQDGNPALFLVFLCHKCGFLAPASRLLLCAAAPSLVFDNIGAGRLVLPRNFALEPKHLRCLSQLPLLHDLQQREQRRNRDWECRAGEVETISRSSYRRVKVKATIKVS